MVVAGPSGRIYSVCSDVPGKEHDATIFRRSSLFKLLHVQGWRPFEGSVLLGDSAYMVIASNSELSEIRNSNQQKAIVNKQKSLHVHLHVQ